MSIQERKRAIVQPNAIPHVITQDEARHKNRDHGLRTAFMFAVNINQDVRIAGGRLDSRAYLQT